MWNSLKGLCLAATSFLQQDPAVLLLSLSRAMGLYFSCGACPAGRSGCRSGTGVSRPRAVVKQFLLLLIHLRFFHLFYNLKTGVSVFEAKTSVVAVPSAAVPARPGLRLSPRAGRLWSAGCSRQGAGGAAALPEGLRGRARGRAPFGPFCH